MIVKLYPVLALDLDGTVRHSALDVPGKQPNFINETREIVLFPDVEKRIWDWKNENAGFVVGITNQGGVAHAFKTLDKIREENVYTRILFKVDPFNMILHSPCDPNGSVEGFSRKTLLRKPAYGMLAYLEMWFLQTYPKGDQQVHWEKSLFVGDREEDRRCALNAGIAFQWADEFFNRS